MDLHATNLGLVAFIELLVKLDAVTDDDYSGNKVAVEPLAVLIDVVIFSSAILRLNPFLIIIFNVGKCASSVVTLEPVDMGQTDTDLWESFIQQVGLIELIQILADDRIQHFVCSSSEQT